MWTREVAVGPGNIHVQYLIEVEASLQFRVLKKKSVAIPLSMALGRRHANATGS